MNFSQETKTTIKIFWNGKKITHNEYGCENSLISIHMLTTENPVETLKKMLPNLDTQKIVCIDYDECEKYGIDYSHDIEQNYHSELYEQFQSFLEEAE